MSGTVGPMVGDKLMVHIEFSVEPVPDADVAAAKAVMDQTLGMSHQFAAVSRTDAERKAASMAKRAFLGGGLG